MLLPAENVLAMLIRRSAQVLAAFGGDLGQRPLVLPTSAFFPDVYARDEASVTRLVERMQEHAGLIDIPLTTRVVAMELGGEEEKQCGSGACSTKAPSLSQPRLEQDGDAWVLNVGGAELMHPVALTSNVARALSHVFLIETARPGTKLDGPPEVASELVAVALGFGPLLLEAAYVYSKSCGGPSVNQLTTLGPGELAVATVVFAAWHAQPLRTARKALGATQCAALDEASAWFETQPRLRARLKAAPAGLLTGTVPLESPKGWLSRWFSRRPEDEVERFARGELKEEELEKALRSGPRTNSAPGSSALGHAKSRGLAVGAEGLPRNSQQDELRALVSEVLSSGK